MSAWEQGSQDEEATRVHELAVRYRVRYEVRPEAHVVGRQIVPVGFELQLYGLHEHGGPGTVCPGCAEVYSVLREIAEWLMPCNDPGSRSELDVPDGALHQAPDEPGRDEVRLAVRILHRNELLAPIDAGEEGCLREVRRKLQQIGLREGSGTA